MTPDQDANTEHNTPLIDLARYKDKWTQGDLTLILTWLLTNGRPCLVIVPTFPKPSYERTMPCIVPMDHAFLWAEETGDGGHCAEVSIQFATALGMNPHNVHGLIRLTSMIREHLGDLLVCPPLPSSEKEVLADVLMTNTDTGRSIESEVIDYV
jgi:hypothetical protein